MDEEGAYGERLRKAFKVEAAPSVVAKTLKNARVAVTEIRCDQENTGLSEAIPVEDAFLLIIQLRDVPKHGMFIDGKQIETAFLPAGTSSFYDLRSSPVADSISAFHHVSFYLPRQALVTISEKEGISLRDSFDHDPGVGVLDPVMTNLARAMLPCFRSREYANQLLIDHLTVATAAHAVKRYGSSHVPPDHPAKALSTRELSVAKERIAANIDGGLRLEEMSDDLSMTPLQLAESFQRSIGSDIHEWRRDLRVERAKRLLARGYEVGTVSNLLAYENVAGFVSDFRRATGCDPSFWAT